MSNETPPKLVDSMFSDTQKGLAWFISVSFVLLIFLWVLHPPVMAPESMAQLNALVSTLVNLVLLAFGYFLGSSRSSKDKDDSNAKIVDKLTTTPVSGNGAIVAAIDAAVAKAAPPAAEKAAPPVVEAVVPPAVEKAVAAAFEKEKNP